MRPGLELVPGLVPRLVPVPRPGRILAATALLLLTPLPVGGARSARPAALSLLAATPPVLAATPSMGWNSWDAYGLTISGDEFQRSVDWFHAHLQPFGWQYVIVDEGWYLQHPERGLTRATGRQEGQLYCRLQSRRCASAVQ